MDSTHGKPKSEHVRRLGKGHSSFAMGLVLLHQYEALQGSDFGRTRYFVGFLPNLDLELSPK